MEEIYLKIPKIKEIDETVISSSIQNAKQSLLNHPEELTDLKELTNWASTERQNLLQNNGYPSDYLQPTYHCIDCKDTGYINTEKCHCFLQAIVNIVYSQSNIKSVLERENFSTFSYEYYSNQYVEQSTGMTPRANIIKVVETCKYFIEHFNTEHSNLLFYGNTGVGKTFLANCIAKELLDKAYTVIYLTSFQLFDILEKNKFGKGEYQEEFQNKFTYILECDLLIIDDLGTELTNAFVNVQLYLCINERYLRQKSTIISTNLSLDQINHTYSERVFSRIASNYTLFKIIGEDIRLKKLF